MKIVLIGGGSYVFAPSVIDDLIIKAKLTNFDFVLVDINLEGAQLLAKITERIALAEGVNVNVSATSDRLQALDGADFVITSLAYQGEKRWNMDYEICKQEGIPYELRETGALSGIVYSFRNITLLMGICRDMEKLCPNAILLNVSNPLTRIHEAINRYTNIKAYGFCNVAQCGAHGYEIVASTLGRHYADIDVTSAGINHFSWILSIRDKATKADLLPEYVEKLLSAPHPWENGQVKHRWYEQYGAVAAPPVDHVADFLPYQPNIHYLDKAPYHGNAEERAKRVANMKLVADGTLDYRGAECFDHGSWEHPALVAVAIHTKTDMYLPILNVPNKNCIPQLPQDAIVEVPVNITGGKVVPATGITLPKAVADMCVNQCEVAEMVARAAVEGDRALAFKIIEVDQAITEKEAAARALARMLEAHEDIFMLR